MGELKNVLLIIDEGGKNDSDIILAHVWHLTKHWGEVAVFIKEKLNNIYELETFVTYMISPRRNIRSEQEINTFT